MVPYAGILCPPALALFIAGAVAVFYLMLAESFRFAARVEPRLEQLDRHGPS